MTNATPTATELATLLEAKRAGNGWSARCPAHDDTTPSLSIGQSPDGRPLWYCHAGCSQAEVLAAFRQRGWWTGPREDRYPYQHAGGRHVVTVKRTDTDAGKDIKRDPAGVTKPDGGYPLYRIESIRANTDKPLMVVEGERTCETAVFLFGDRYELTTAIGGAGKAEHTDWTPARGREVVIWPDADGDGLKHGEDMAKLCTKAGATSVRIVDTILLPTKWDLADPIPDDVVIERLADQAKPYEPADRLDKAFAEPSATYWAAPAPHIDWIVKSWLPASCITLLAGHGGGGKTKLATMLAAGLASGRSVWLPGGPQLSTSQGAAPVVFASWENNRDDIRRMLGDWRAEPDEEKAPTPDLLGDRLTFRDLAECGPVWGPCEGGSKHTSTMGELTKCGARLREDCERRKARLLILDPLAACYGLNENDRALVRGFLADWNGWARRTGCAVLLIAHPPKDGADYSGSTDWHNAPRAMWTLGKVDDPQDKSEKPRKVTKLACEKSSYAKVPAPLRLDDWKWWQAFPWKPSTAAAASPPADDDLGRFAGIDP